MRWTRMAFMIVLQYRPVILRLALLAGRRTHASCRHALALPAIPSVLRCAQDDNGCCMVAADKYYGIRSNFPVVFRPSRSRWAWRASDSG